MNIGGEFTVLHGVTATSLARWVSAGPIVGAEFYWSGTQWPPDPRVMHYFYARHYNARHPTRKVNWLRLNRPQRAEAERMWTAGLLGQ